AAQWENFGSGTTITVWPC
uniref:Uncharacterized protein n=1 Tax=Sarcophilus harrisii TaxID=9305 RepID=A0A7N4P9G7_SARHA